MQVFSTDSVTNRLGVNIESDVERVAWNPFDPYVLAVIFIQCTNDRGGLFVFDSRNIAAPLFKTQAHGKQCVLDFSPGVPYLMATASADKTVKLWDARTFEVIAQKEMGIE